MIKSKRALKQTGYSRVVIAGGVSANQHLRQVFEQRIGPNGKNVFYPSLAFCTDNGAMIAYAGMQRLKAKQFDGFDEQVKPRWPLDSLPPL